jgi:O-antigen/teichoic acid export membrane protein
MESKLLEIELDEINECHAAYERAHARLVMFSIGLAIGLVIALIALPILLWPRTSARVEPSSLWPLLALAAFWVALTLGAYITRQRAFRRVRQGCLRLRRAGYKIRKQDVHFSGSVFGLSELSGAADAAKTVDVNRLSARSLHTVMQ